MIKIEDLMQYASRRKVEEIAASMGYPKATEYPDEVLEEVKVHCSKKQRSRTAVAKEATHTESINTAQEDFKDVEVTAVSRGYPKATEYPDEASEEAQARCSKKQQSHAAVAEEATQQKTTNTAQEDLKDVDEGSQHRAAAMRIAGDALTLYYYGTEQFTVPGLKDKVEESHSKFRQVLRGVAAAYDPEHFLAQTYLAQMAAGRNGSMPSLNGSSSPSNEFKKEDDGELSGSP